MSTPIGEVARNTLEYFADVIYPKIVRIVTPFPEQVPLRRCGLDSGLRQIVKLYEPEVAKGGLYRHQADFLEAFAANENGDFIMTTATGSGKSLCFWVWVFDCLRKDPSATALLCFPTQALMWSQAERMCRLSNENSLRFPGTSKTAYGGELDIGHQRIGWTIWQGVGRGATLVPRLFSPSFAGRYRAALFYLSLFFCPFFLVVSFLGFCCMPICCGESGSL